MGERRLRRAVPWSVRTANTACCTRYAPPTSGSRVRCASPAEARGRGNGHPVRPAGDLGGAWHPGKRRDRYRRNGLHPHPCGQPAPAGAGRGGPCGTGSHAPRAGGGSRHLPAAPAGTEGASAEGLPVPAASGGPDFPMRTPASLRTTPGVPGGWRSRCITACLTTCGESPPALLWICSHICKRSRRYPSPGIFYSTPNAPE